MAPSGRITKKRPARIFKKSTYIKALPNLLKDTNGRCAYSMVSEKDATSTMEVDHFNPTLLEPARSDYGNLLPSLRMCNGKKSNKWPTKEQRAKGLHFIDPSKEKDYDHQIFEDPKTSELVGTTPAARYHIIHLDLNHPNLVLRRQERAIFGHLLNSPAKLKSEWSNASEAAEAIKTLKALVERGIPPIKAPPSAPGP